MTGRALVIAVLACQAAPGWAQTTHQAVCDPDDPKSCVLPLLEGEEAPWEGVLMTFRRSAKLGVKADQCDSRVQLAVEAEQKTAKVGRDAEKDKRESANQSFQAQLAAAQKVAEEAAPGWYEHPGLWFGIGVATTVALTLTAVVVLERLEP